MTNTRKEAFIKEYRSVYLEDPNFENVNDLDLYNWWLWACDWQKAQDKDIPMKYKRMEFNAKLQKEIEDLQKERDYWFNKAIEYEKNQTFYKKF